MRRQTVVALAVGGLLVLRTPGPAAAGASWVLWMQEQRARVSSISGLPTLPVVFDWVPFKVFGTLPQCQDGMVQTFAQAKALGKQEGVPVLVVAPTLYLGTPGTGEDRTYRFQCLPDTVQPH
jgi:hypothetical protein